MKITILFFALSINYSFSQTSTESDYVFEGRTFQYSIPKGFKGVKLYPFDPYTVYLLDTVRIRYFKMESEDLDSIPFTKGIVCGYGSKDDLNGIDLKFITDNFEEFKDEFGQIEIIKEPVLSKIAGITLARASIKLNDFDKGFNIDCVNISAIDFGEYIFYFATFNFNNSDAKLMNYLSDEMHSSIKIVETQKKNTLANGNSYFRQVQNNNIATDLFSDNIAFSKSISSYWQNGYSSDYLAAYDYGHPDEQIEGNVFTFSAGMDTKDLMNDSLLTLLQNKLLDYEVTQLTELGSVVGDEHTFKKYKITGDSKTNKFLKQLYTTVIDDELLIFIAERSEFTTANFTKYYEAFVKSFYYLNDAGL